VKVEVATGAKRSCPRRAHGCKKSFRILRKFARGTVARHPLSASPKLPILARYLSKQLITNRARSREAFLLRGLLLTGRAGGLSPDEDGRRASERGNDKADFGDSVDVFGVAHGRCNSPLEAVVTGTSIVARLPARLLRYFTLGSITLLGKVWRTNVVRLPL
jgi:hypothetical protein